MPRLPRPTIPLVSVLAIAGLLAAAQPVQARRSAEPTEPSAGETTPAPRAGGRCTLSLAAAPATPVAAGETVTLSGHLTCPEPAAAEGRPVTIYSREHGAGLQEVTTLSAGSEGAFEATAPVTANTVFIARAFRARRAKVAVEVGDAVTLSGPTGAAAALFTHGGYRHGVRSARAKFTGTISPAVSGARVALQRRYAATGEPWHTVGYTRTDETGAFSFSRGFRLSGQVSFRAVAHLHGHVASDSQELSYSIGQSQNTLLTITAAEDPLPAGGSTTISGVLAAGAGHAVQLITRTPGKPPAAVAFVISGEGGAYSFPVSPTVDTTYRVLAGKVESAPLFLGVLPALALASPPATATLGQPLSIAGTLTGAATGAPVRLEIEQPDGHRRSVAATTAQPDGSFTLAYTFERTGSFTLRVTTPRDQATIGASSTPFAVTVSAPPEA